MSLMNITITWKEDLWEATTEDEFKSTYLTTGYESMIFSFRCIIPTPPFLAKKIIEHGELVPEGVGLMAEASGKQRL